MKKIFAPLNRSKFIFYIFSLWIINGLYINFAMFFDINGATAPFVLILDLIAVFILVLKRLFDLFSKLWKSVIFALIYSILLVVTYSTQLSTITLETSGLQINNTALWLLYPICSTVVLLSLSLENNKNTKFLNLKWKPALKRIVLLILIFSAYKTSTFYFDTIFQRIDFRMYPSLRINDRLLVNKKIDTISLTRGDIVCVKNENVLNYPLRIIGLPNEEIKLEGDKIYINNQPYFDEFAFYSKNLKPINFKEAIKLDNSSYLLIGDNRYYDKRGEMLTKDRSKNKVWKSIDEIENLFYSKNNNGLIYFKATRKDLFGKVVALHYDTKSPNKETPRNKTSYVFALKNKKFGFNSNAAFESLFGKP